MPITKYEGQTFEKQVFILEETFFVDSVIRDCDLFYSGGDFEYVNSRFEACRLHLRGEAARTRLVLGMFGMLKEEQKPQTSLKTSGTVN